jgi:hypothetical protein
LLNSCQLGHRSLEIGNQSTFWTGHYLNQFPALGAPIIQDLSGGVDN